MPQSLSLPVPDNAAPYLDSLAGNVHRAFFSRYPPLRVRWGHQIARKRRRSIRLGSYNHATTEIRIHPLLNSQQVPAYVIESVIHHEYLHHVLGPHHNRRFHAHERKFHYHREAQEWIRRNLFLLLGRKKSEFAQRGAPPPVPQPQRAQLALF
jgi:hypothetical protein